MNRVLVLAARRTPISPKNGVHRNKPFFELAAQAITDLQADLPERLELVSVIAGNALGAGGNPARLMALAAGLPYSIPALTIDTQCCSGLDAIGLAYQHLRGTPLLEGQTLPVIFAGGAESASLAPVRSDRQTGQTYEEAPFTPWPERDPSMIQAAKRLEADRSIDGNQMMDWAIRSHYRNLQNLHSDSFPRRLTRSTCERAQLVAPYNPTLMAPLADGAAFVGLTAFCGEQVDQARIPANYRDPTLEVLDYRAIGADPMCPGLLVAALEPWLRSCEQRFAFDRKTLLVSLMESFASQVLANITDLDLNAELVNPWGGLLARGHPIGASGAVLVCDLFEHLEPNQHGLALIPAAGGLASGLLVRRLSS